MSKWPTRAEKLHQFKERILEDLDVIADDGLIVHLKGGSSIDFTAMMDCFVRTRKMTLYKLMDKLHDGVKIDRTSVFKAVQEELTEIDNEPDPT